METLMAQAQDLQTKIADAQDSLAQMHVKGIAQNGAVVVDMTGKYDLLSVVVQPVALEKGAESVSKFVFDAYKDAKEKVDIAVIEVGMGGRLDSTNVITPMLSVITNIGLDHTQFLGDTPKSITQVYNAKGEPVDTPVFRYKNVLASYTHLYQI